MYREGRGVNQDYKQAIALFHQACAQGEVVGCEWLMFANAEGYGEKINTVKAADQIKKSCKQGNNYRSCYTLGTMYQRGQSVEKNGKKAVNLYYQACNNGVEVACLSLGAMYQAGHGVVRDHQKITALYRQVCGKGFFLACAGLKQLLKDNRAKRTSLYIHNNGY
jgi:TPR repeat protein